MGGDGISQAEFAERWRIRLERNLGRQRLAPDRTQSRDFI